MGVVEDWASAIWQSEDDDPVYECQRCESQFEVEYYVCPDCGGYRVERTDWGDCD
jgi:rRNA maturation endonuclease Nob1